MKFPSIAPILVLAAFTIECAQAQTKPPRTVTRDELRVCMTSESELAARKVNLKERSEKNRAESTALRAEAEELTRERERAGQNEGRIDRFERHVKTHNNRVKVAQQNAESLNKDAEAFNQALTAHNEQCGGVSYNKDDREAILKERESATK